MWRNCALIALIATMLNGCERTTVACQNPLGCDHEGHVIFRGIGG